MKKFVAIGLISGTALTQGLAAEERFSLDKATPAQKEAIAALEKLGGKVTFSQGFSVQCFGTRITDEGLAHLEGQKWRPLQRSFSCPQSGHWRRVNPAERSPQR